MEFFKNALWVILDKLWFTLGMSYVLTDAVEIPTYWGLFLSQSNLNVMSVIVLFSHITHCGKFYIHNNFFFQALFERSNFNVYILFADIFDLEVKGFFFLEVTFPLIKTKSLDFDVACLFPLFMVHSMCTSSYFHFFSF